MPSRTKLYVPLLVLLALAAACRPHAAKAQAPGTFDGSDLHRVVDIADAKWLVRAGDDPRWAQPDLDDSHWQVFSTQNDLQDIFGVQKPPIVWYRLHVKVSPSEVNLALSQDNLASAFEIYTDGVLIMRAGRVVPFAGVTPIFTESLIPESQIKSGVVVIAVRIALGRGDWLGARPGMGPTNILLGYGLQLEDRRHYHVLVYSVTQWISTCLGLLVGLIALGLFLVERQRREYFWAFLYGLSAAAYLSINLVRSDHAIPLALFDVLTGVLGSLPAIAAFRFVWAALGRRAGRWIFIYQALLLILPPLLYIGFDDGWVRFGGLVFSLLPLSLIMAIVLPVVVIRDGRRGNREAWVLLIPLLFSSFETYLHYTGYIFSAVGIKSPRLDSLTNALNAMTVGTLRLSLETATSAIALCSIALIIVLRTNRSSRQLSRAAAEFEAARSVQSLLLSRENIATPGFAVESVYKPAAEVGGDFFLISPGVDGSLLIVVGDVSGKGLPAALRVSLILGALQREPSRRPSEVLAGLNKVLCAQSDGGFTTCGCALLSHNGAVVLANAGHLSPYRNGVELAVDGGLPLGLVEQVEYEEAHYSMERADTLTYLSDGVVEARNTQGELLGFDRVQAMSGKPAAEIAAAAQDFGQDDDITVVTVRRLTTAGA